MLYLLKYATIFFCDLNDREKFEIESRVETIHLNGYDWTPFILSTPPIHYISLICFGKARSQSQSDWLIANFVETALSISKSIFEENAFDRTDYASFGPLGNSGAHFQINENIIPVSSRTRTTPPSQTLIFDVFIKPKTASYRPYPTLVALISPRISITTLKDIFNFGYGM